MVRSSGLKRTKEEIEAKQGAASGREPGGDPSDDPVSSKAIPLTKSMKPKKSIPGTENPERRSSELKTTGLYRTQHDIEAKRKASLGGGKNIGSEANKQILRGDAVMADVQVPSDSTGKPGLRNSKFGIKSKQMAIDSSAITKTKGIPATDVPPKPTGLDSEKFAAEQGVTGIPAVRLSAVRYLDSSTSLPDTIQTLPDPDMDASSHQAGAYLESLAHPGPERLEPIRYSLLGLQPQLLSTAMVVEDPITTQEEANTTQTATDDSHATPNRNPSEMAGLATASIVHQKSVLDIDLKPVDMEAAEQKKANREKQRQIFVVAAVILLLLSSIIVLGSLFGLRNKQQSSEAAAAPLPQQSPTVVHSSTPSESPSAAPSKVLQSLMEFLSKHTLESLQDPFSPQSRAFNWLSKHRNISNLQERRKLQLFALATIHYAFDGPTWPNGLNEDWLSYERSECLWFSSSTVAWGSMTGAFLGNQGFNSCNDAGEFQVLNLQEAFDLGGLYVPFPREIALLTNLVEIDLTGIGLNTSLSDDILPAVSPLDTLQSLRLVSNFITGTIPKEIGSWTKLTYLDIGNNRLTGTIPTQIATMTKLEIISISSNELAGGIASQLGNLSNLRSLDLRFCGLNGRIPTEMGLLSNLSGLMLDYNSISGSIPTQIGLT